MLSRIILLLALTIALVLLPVHTFLFQYSHISNIRTKLENGQYCKSNINLLLDSVERSEYETTNRNMTTRLLCNLVIPAVVLLGFSDPSFARVNVITFKDSIEYSNVYLKYFFAGGFCASFSHAVAVPIDVIKIRLQTAPAMYSGIIGTGAKIMRDEGFPMLFKGLGPTVLGYSVHGSLKYGFYETFKPIMLNMLTVAGFPSMSLETKIVEFILAGIVAETIASTAILPLEAARIRMISDPTFASGTIDSLQKVMKLSGNSSIFQSLPAILFKHIPFTVTQLTSFELAMATVYSFVAVSGLSPSEALTFRFAATILVSMMSGALASLVSQPGDTLMSRLSSTVCIVGTEQVENPILKLGSLAKDIGFIGLFRGTRARLLHICVIYVVQLAVYDFIKGLFGIPPTGCPGR